MRVEEKYPNPFHDSGSGKCQGWGELPSSARPGLPATPRDSGSASIMHHMKSGPHQQPASVESESDHLMLHLISLISPCLQLV